MIPFLVCWFKDTRSSKGHRSNLRFQFNGMFAVAPGRNTLPAFGSKTSRTTEHKVTGTGRKNFLMGQYRWQWLQLWNYSFFYTLIPRLVDLGYGRSHTIYLMLIQSVFCLLKNPAPALQAAATYLCSVFKRLFYRSIRSAASGQWGTW